MKTTAASDIQIGDLIDRAGDLKGELVEFAQGPRFARRLDALLFDVADPDGYLDEVQAVLTIDHFALQHRLSDGRTVVERFVVAGVIAPDATHETHHHGKESWELNHGSLPG